MKPIFFAPVIFIMTIFATLVTRGIAIDFTKENIFGLSKYSMNIARELPNNLEIEYYHSLAAANEEPILRAQIKRISAILNQYSKQSKGKISIKEIETRELSNEEFRALQAGLIPIRENENKLSPIFSGLIIRDKQHELVVPLLNGQNGQSIEFEITSAISQFIPGRIKSVGIISGLDWFATKNQTSNNGIATISKAIIRENPTLILDNNWSEIPAAIDALFIAQPNAISQNQAQKLIDFINSGKSAFVCIDPASSVSHDNNNGIELNDLSIALVLQYFGLNINGEIIMDKAGALRISAKDQSGEHILPQPLFFSATPKTDLFGKLGAVNFATAGFIETNPKPNFEYQSILKTSFETAKINAIQALANQNPAQLIREFESLNSEFSIATLAKSRQNGGKLLLVSDCDFLSDGLYQNYVGTAASNSDFALGAIDYFFDESEMAALRSKSSGNSPLKVIEEMKSNAEADIAINEAIINQKLEGLNQEMADNPNSSKIEAISDDISKSRTQLREIKEGVKRRVQGLKNLIILICGFAIPAIFLSFGLYIYRIRKHAHHS